MRTLSTLVVPILLLGHIVETNLMAIADESANDKKVALEFVHALDSNAKSSIQDWAFRYKNLSSDSKYKSVVAQAYALALIQKRDYSEAWKVLLGVEKASATSSASVRKGHEVLKLWLLMQAGRDKQTEEQFQKIVRLVLDKDNPIASKAEECKTLGRFVGMLESMQGDRFISSRSLEKTKQAIDRSDSKMVRDAFNGELQFCKKWGEDLQLCFSQFSSEEGSFAEDKVREAELAVEAAAQELEKLKVENEQESKDRRGTENDQKKTRLHLADIFQQMEQETPGRPQLPVPPSRPAPAQTFYERADPKTGRREIDQSKTREDHQRYEREMTRYREREAEYQADRQTYPARLKAWEAADAARRQNLQQQQEDAEKKLVDLKGAIQGKTQDIRENTVAIKAAAEVLETAERKVKIQHLAMAHVKEFGTSETQLCRPSNFELLDMQREMSRLLKSMKEL